MKNLLVIAFVLIGGMSVATAQQTSPVWPGCEGSDSVKKCFNKKLAEHVRANYEYPKNDAGEYVRGKVKIDFNIDENGKVIVNSVEGPKPKVNQAAKEMIMKIPEMEPGTLQGEPDSRNFKVSYKF